MALVKRFEGLRREAAALPQGGWVVGYGHTLTARAGAVVDEADAEALLLFDLSRTAQAVDAALLAPVTAPQFEALVSFAFNVGADAFAGSSVVKRVNEGAYLQAAAALELWRRAEFDGDALVVDALVRRRAAEKAHFLTPPDGFSPAPSPLIRPLLDHGAAVVRPSDLRAALAQVSYEGGAARAVARLGEPAPSALVAAADALRTRLDLILASPAAPPPAGPPPAGAPPPPEVAEPSPADPGEVAEPPAEPPSDPTPAVAEPEPEPAREAEPEPTPTPLPDDPAEPLFRDADPPAPAPDDPAGPPAAADDADRGSPPPPAPPGGLFSAVAEDDPDLADVPPLRVAAGEPRRDWLREEPAGRPALRRRLARHPLLLTGLGAAGAVMFVCALIGLLTSSPAIGALVLGLAGVALMAPAAAWLLSRRLDRGED